MENPKIYEQQNIVLDPSLTPGTPSYRKAYHQAYRRKNATRLKEYDHDRFNGRRKRAHQVQPYQINPEQYEAKLVEQNHCCAICKVHQSKLKKALCVDHNHQTGEVRGLLCDMCNRAIGLLRESLQLFASATAYLQRYTNQTQDVLEIPKSHTGPASAQA